jgi:hypothetical protein
MDTDRVGLADIMATWHYDNIGAFFEQDAVQLTALQFSLAT